MDIVQGFLSYLTAEKGLSKNTATSYQLDLKKFHAFLTARNTDFLSFSKSDIVENERKSVFLAVRNA